MLEIRQETSSDHLAVKELLMLAFDGVPHSDQQEHLLVERLRLSSSFVPELSLVACDDEQVVGHILLSEVDLEGSLPPEVKLLALAPLAVLPARQKQGIGARLLEASRLRALDLGYAGIVLLGAPAYYGRFDYRPLSAFKINLPLDVPCDYCQGLELFPRALRGVKGTIVYPPAFGI